MIVEHVLSFRERKNKPNVKDEQVKRSVLKTVSWRAIGTLDTILISWIVTGTLALAFSIGAIELITKMVLYYLHERTWNNIKWGRNEEITTE